MWNFQRQLLYRTPHITASRFQKQPQEVLYTKGFLKNFTKLTVKHLCQSIFFFPEICRLRLATLLKKRLRQRCFPMNFVKFLRTSFLQNTSGRLLLSFARYFVISYLGRVRDWNYPYYSTLGDFSGITRTMITIVAILWPYFRLQLY